MFTLIESTRFFDSPYVVALVTLVVYLLFAKLSDWLIKLIVKKYTSKTKSEVDDKLLMTTQKPLYYTFVLVGLASAFVYLKVSEKTLVYVNSSIYTLVAIIWLITFLRILGYIVEMVFHKGENIYLIPQDLFPMVRNLAKVFIIGAFVVIILSIWNVNVTPLLASAGIVGAAVAFAAKDTLANFFGAMSIFADKPFKVGDIITLDSGEKGSVVSIGIRSTRIKTFDDVLITIPNSTIANAKITNDSAPNPVVRVKLPVSVAYGTDLNAVDKILLEIVTNHSEVLKDPAPRVFFGSFGESALNLDLLFWLSDPSLRLRVSNDVNRAIYERFKEAGIKIPFPQREIYINN